MKKSSPYGSWKSPITSDLIVSESIRLGQIRVDGEDLYWVENRPKEGGRYVIVRRTPDGSWSSLTSPPINVRTRVHEYGGGAYLVDNGVLYYSNFSDQRLYQQTPGDAPRPLTSKQKMFYADTIMDQKRNRLISIREDHTHSDQQPINTIVSIHLREQPEDQVGQILVQGSDFYSNPRLSPDGQFLTWLSWNHPNMPWDGTELWMAAIQPDGSLGPASHIAGGPNESLFQPEWSPDGRIYFISDRTGWWNLYRRNNGQIDAMYPMESEFGNAQWIFGLSTYGFSSPNHIICTYTQQGRWHLGCLDVRTRVFKPIDLSYTEFEGIQVSDSTVYCQASSPTTPSSIIKINLESNQIDIIRRSVDFYIDPQYLSLPEAIEYPTDDGQTAHAFYYKPCNADYQAANTERPPLIVKSHGGPTGSASMTLNVMIQFWTSRGFAVLDVNYGGSTGYGRAYRERLNGQWGIVDVDDCVNGVDYLIARGEVDAKRLAIAGGSAGGYTTLSALTFRTLFTAGSSYYGVSDLEALVRDTHKFESRYLDRLIGPYPEQQALYRQRSPIHFTDQLSCPIILFQGIEDKVVPPEQAELMFDAVKRKGLPVAYLAFEEEQHGFRKAETIKRVLDAELYFYSKIFKFQLPVPMEPISIENETLLN
jgi:dipeptidyl aminopeptidase/acylaminoacyl peptidase